MWAEPDDPSAVLRMRAACARACSALGLVPIPDSPEAWGWRGRTIGRPVLDVNGPAWLRIACAPTDQIVATFWHGGLEAQRLIPVSIPRPRLHRWLDWSENGWTYRAELYEYIAVRPVAPHAVITASPDLSPAWWSALRMALDAVARVNTTRMTVQPGFLAWAMPHYLGVAPSDYANSSWTTAHGDLHFANLCAPELRILDWEGWGLAPPGYDGAILHSHSLLVPHAASRIRIELAHLLGGPTGRFAELVAITELLHAAEQGGHQVLTEPLLHRAASILGHSACSRLPR